MSNIDFFANNSALLRAAYAAMDQTYGTTKAGYSLQPIDNSGTGRIQPWQTPPGWKVFDSVADPELGGKVVIYRNELTNQVMAVPMGTNGSTDVKGWWSDLKDYGLSQWQSKNPIDESGKSLKIAVYEALNKALEVPGAQLICAGDSKGHAQAQFICADIVSDRESGYLDNQGFHNLAATQNENMAIIGNSGPGAEMALKGANPDFDMNSGNGIATYYSASRRSSDGAQEQVSRTGGRYFGDSDGTVHYFDQGVGDDPSVVALNGNIYKYLHRLVYAGWDGLAAVGGDFSKLATGRRDMMGVNELAAIAGAFASIGQGETVNDLEAQARIGTGLLAAFVMAPVAAAGGALKGEFGIQTVLGFVSFLAWGPLGKTLMSMLGVSVAGANGAKYLGEDTGGVFATKENLLSFMKSVNAPDTAAPDTTRFFGMTTTGGRYVADLADDGSGKVYCFENNTRTDATIGMGRADLKQFDAATGRAISDGVLTCAGDTSKFIQKTDTNADGTFDKTVTTTQLSGNVTYTTTDLNNDNRAESEQLLIDGKTFDALKTLQRADAEKQLSALDQAGQINSGFYDDFTRESANLLLGSSGFDLGSGLNPFSGGLGLQPIGAFYDSQSSAHDNAPSIARLTPRLLDAGLQAVSAQQLAALDLNRDNTLSLNESGALRLWQDLNENGRTDAGEILAVTQNIGAADYAALTRGNGRLPVAEPTAPAAPSHAVSAPADRAESVPDSNYRYLRDNDNRYYLNAWQWYQWTSNDIKVNWNAKQILIGTDGNDSFGVQWFSQTRGIDINLFTQFLGGGGDDEVGGSTRNDSIWGGTGNDSLWGGAGDDKLYGEEGNDQLCGEEGADYLDGGAGADRLFGFVGNDVLIGGDGNDVLYGFTPTNAAKQTLDAGESDDDYLSGGAGDDALVGGLGNDTLLGGIGDDYLSGGQGADTLFGGEGKDELRGNENDDVLMGDAGDDKLFGDAGNDILHGGEGNDILVGYAPSNDIPAATPGSDNDILFGEGGNDNLYGDLGDDILDGGTGDDILLGEQGSDTLFGGEGSDELQGNEGNDKLQGGNGDDRLFGQVGDDTLWGGDGNDLLQGFTASNEDKQSLSAGESDNDLLFGGAGSDILIGGLGNDQLFGGTGRDELQGGQGNDMLYGEEGDDNLFGQVGNDTLYGGDGDDLLQGFTASNESKQSLAAGETDDDYLNGGAGNDTLLGGLGNDILDGGAGADVMVGGRGDDTYIVNSVNDVVYEKASEGYDIVISSTNYLLNAGVEELRLLEGATINGTGNALDNLIVGNSADNILDGVTGADTMIGGAGNDTYYIDNIGDRVTERANEGIDTIQSSISYTLGDNLENIVLLDFSKPELGLVDGTRVLVFGYPKRNELDYMQGDEVDGYQGTCALTSIANLRTQAGRPTTESDVVNLAIRNNWAVTDPSLPAYQLGGSSVFDQRAILDSYKIRNDVIVGYNETGLANLVKSGRGVIVAVNAGVLWEDNAYRGGGSVNHAVTLTGAVFRATDGGLMGFYIADSGRGMVSDMTRFVSIELFRRAVNVPNAYSIYTIEPVKFWQENINATGNAGNNTLIGNRGDNLMSGGAGDDVLQGGAGNDTLVGGAGNDILEGGAGDDVFRFNAGDGQDVVTDEGGVDTLAFGAGIRAPDVTVSRTGSSLLLTIKNQGSVRIDNAAKGGIEKVSFADGTLWYAKADGSGFNASLTGSVKITGQAKQGQALTLSSTLADADGMGALSWQWQISQDGVTWRDISGANRNSFNLGQAEVGQRLRARVSYVDGRGNAESVTTVASDRIANINDAPTGSVTLSGTAAQNQRLVAAHSLADLDGLGAMTWQWQSSADGKTWTSISGANDSSLGLTEAEVGRLIRVSASYTDGFGTRETVASAPTTVVANVNDSPTGSVTMSGSATQGQTLTAANTLADADGMGAIAYQWQSSADGRTWKAITGATANKLTLAAAQAGNQIRAVASYKDGRGTTESVVSAASGPVGGTWTGTSGKDVLKGLGGDDILDGGAGADTMAGGLGNDTYLVDNIGDVVTEAANAGIDLVKSSVSYTLGANLENLTLTGTGAINGTGNALANILSGNSAKNILAGGAGADTYLFDRGAGQDTIVENDKTAGVVDVARFGAGVAHDQLWFRHVGKNLEVSIIGTTDKLTVQDWYAGTANRVEQFRAGNGKTLADKDVEKLVQAMAALAPPLSGQTTLPVAQRNSLASTLAASWL